MSVHDRRRTRRMRQGRFLEVVGVLLTMLAAYIAIAGLSIGLLASLRIAVPLLVMGTASFVIGYRWRLTAPDGE
jgi:hypothetical protein